MISTRHYLSARRHVALCIIITLLSLTETRADTYRVTIDGIDTNVIENVDRGLIWMNNGLAENIHVYNNTIFCADAGKRSGALLSSYTKERLNNWVFRNNIVVVAWSRPRKLIQDKRGVPDKIIAKDNVCINLTVVPAGNYVNKDPELSRQTERPWAFYMPRSVKSFVVDRGADVGFPFVGKAPDIGAVELGAKYSWEKRLVP